MTCYGRFCARNEEHETTLARELEFVGRYLQIEQVRFSDRLKPLIEVDPAIGSAARTEVHTPAPCGERTAARNRASRGRRCSASERAPGRPRPGADGARRWPRACNSRAGILWVGLANTRARLAGLYGDRGTLEVVGADGGGVIAIVRLPYHEARSDAGEPR